MENNNQASVFETEYIPSVHRFGRITNLLGVACAFLPILVLTFVFHLIPPTSAIIAGFLMQASINGILWFVEPISYSPILGAAGTYMSFLSGNISNLRLPAAMAAQTAADVEPGSEKGSILATVGIAVSIVVNVVMLTVGVVLGSAVLARVPENVTAALNNILPALFGAMLGQQIVGKPKLGIVAVVLTTIMFILLKAGMLAFLPGTPNYAIIIVGVFGTILIGRKMYGTK